MGKNYSKTPRCGLFPPIARKSNYSWLNNYCYFMLVFREKNMNLYRTCALSACLSWRAFCTMIGIFSFLFHHHTRLPQGSLELLIIYVECLPPFLRPAATLRGEAIRLLNVTRLSKMHFQSVWDLVKHAGVSSQSEKYIEKLRGQEGRIEADLAAANVPRSKVNTSQCSPLRGSVTAPATVTVHTLPDSSEAREEIEEK